MTDGLVASDVIHDGAHLLAVNLGLPNIETRTIHTNNHDEQNAQGYAKLIRSPIRRLSQKGRRLTVWTDFWESAGLGMKTAALPAAALLF